MPEGQLASSSTASTFHRESYYGKALVEGSDPQFPRSHLFEPYASPVSNRQMKMLAAANPSSRFTTSEINSPGKRSISGSRATPISFGTVQTPADESPITEESISVSPIQEEEVTWSPVHMPVIDENDSPLASVTHLTDLTRAFSGDNSHLENDEDLSTDKIFKTTAEEADTSDWSSERRRHRTRRGRNSRKRLSNVYSGGVCQVTWDETADKYKARIDDGDKTLRRYFKDVHEAHRWILERSGQHLEYETTDKSIPPRRIHDLVAQQPQVNNCNMMNQETSSAVMTTETMPMSVAYECKSCLPIQTGTKYWSCQHCEWVNTEWAYSVKFRCESCNVPKSRHIMAEDVKDYILNYGHVPEKDGTGFLQRISFGFHKPEKNLFARTDHSTGIQSLPDKRDALGWNSDPFKFKRGILTDFWRTIAYGWFLGIRGIAVASLSGFQQDGIIGLTIGWLIGLAGSFFLPVQQMSVAAVNAALDIYSNATVATKVLRSAALHGVRWFRSRKNHEMYWECGQCLIRHSYTNQELGDRINRSSYCYVCLYPTN